MFRKFSAGLDDMPLALMIGLYTLPLVGFFILPFFGPTAAVLTAVALFIAALFACWGICGWKLFRS